MNPQVEMFGERATRRSTRAISPAADAWLALRVERAIAIAEELHEDHWPRWLAFAVDRVRAGDPWLMVPAGELHPFEPSVPVPSPYRVASPMAAELLRVGWRPAESTFVEQQTAYWIERIGYVAAPDEYNVFCEAMRVVVRFLAAEVGEHDWPLAVFCRDGEGWAFALLPFDTGSYINDGEVEWLGTTWQPGCECGEPLDDGSDSLGSDDEHRAECPARRSR